MQVDAHDLAHVKSEDDVARARNQCESRALAEKRRLHAVLDGRGAAALDIAQDGHARIDLRRIADELAHLDGGACALRHDDDAVLFTCLVSVHDFRADLIEIVLDLGHEDVFSAARDARHHRKPARLFSHDLDEDDAPVRRRRVAQLVDRLQDRVRRRIGADRVVRAPDVVLDRRRQADDRHAVARKVRRAREAAVAADDDEAFDIVLLELLHRRLAPFIRMEPLGAPRAEECAASLDEVADAARRKLLDVSVQKSRIAAINAENPHAFGYRRAHDGACRRIHARAVAAGSHNTNRTDHVSLSYPLFLRFSC